MGTAPNDPPPACYDLPVMRTLTTLAILAILAALPARAATCESLAATALADTTIATAQSVPAGAFTPPYGNAIDKLPAFCRVAGVIKPTPDSYIRFEVWLPASNWNGKFLGVGNGGFAGAAVAAFHCEAPARYCAFIDPRRIVAGDDGGRVYFLALEEK